MRGLQKYNEVSEAFDQLFPICRSILGEGYRTSLEILKQYVPFVDDEFVSGSQVLNWKVPKEWVIREAWIKNSKGETIVDFRINNLHVMNYSAPIDQYMTLSEMKEHIYTSESSDDAIPYVFSYYKERWGFCMCKRQLESLTEDTYHVYIDSEFCEGKVVTGTAILEGESQEEVLLSSYLCHPSMANNELSGPLVLAMLYQKIAGWKNRKYTYRFVINPETIGSICYLSKYGEHLSRNVKSGMVLTCLGGEQNLRWKKSRREDAPFNEVVSWINYVNTDNITVEEFDPSEGSDERQYCSPGFDMPVGQMARMVYGHYEGYHNSLDTKDCMGIENIIESANKIEQILRLHEERVCYINKYPYGEVKLGDYDLYPSLNANGKRDDRTQDIINNPDFIREVMFVLNYADGKHSEYYFAERLGIGLEKVRRIMEILVNKGLIERCI